MKTTKLVILLLISFKSFAIQDTLSFTPNDSISLRELADSGWNYINLDSKVAYDIALWGLKRPASNNSDLIERTRLLHLAAFIEYQYICDYYKSTKHLNELWHISDSIGYKRGIALAQLNLSNVHYYQNDYKKDMELLNESVKNAKLIGDSLIFMAAYLGIADILSMEEKYDSSNALLKQVMDYSIKHKRLDYQYILYEQIATNFSVTKDYDSSIYYFEKTLDVSNQLNNKYNILSTKINLIYNKFLNDTLFFPLPELMQLQKECKENHFYYLVYSVGYTTAYILEQHGKYKEAFSYYKEARYVQDSISNKEKARRISELESAYEIQQKEFENTELLRINSYNSLKLKKRFITISLSFFIIIQAFILLIIIYRKYKTIKIQERKIYEQEKLIMQKEKEAIEEKLQLQNRELTTKVMKIYQHNQLNEKVISGIEEANKLLGMKKTPQSKEKLQSLVNTLKSSANNQMWSEFEKTFYETHPGFLERVSEKYPELTSNELKLCIFLFLNLRTKEISVITQQSLESINKARTRLRKKLNLLNTSHNITTFLKSI